ncbi:FimV/HubP family polar landmark protein [Shewanella litorisediminis]|uniref:Pilus assembly protein FimV n=1 Tax=Shewanella litorisediminis TaxID=1173586 RepID=A0ABX7FZE5_9GAMM|nr:FimV/HubP family polar landmark protein [Shewanella litorisediminis]MCL2919534.1 hypothetical protein [Shewanella litorisediminis]QRH00430.1 hypothetical protein JQC75_11025 [Shewanella litorisediminis]
MNFRTSYLVGFLASVLAVSTIPQFSEVRAAEPLKITGPDGQSREAQSRQYGPTTVQDTFWSIAQKVRPDNSVSVYQVMAAIYDANPHAFSGANYNTLEKGMILLIPSKEVMLAIPKNLAQQRALEQDRAWRSGKVEPKPAAAKPASAKPVAPEEPKVVAQTPKVETKPAPVPAVDPKLVEENQALSAEISRLTEELNVRKNDVESLSTQVEQLTEEVQTLKANLAAITEESDVLKAENKTLKQAQALAEVEANKPGDLWRSLMDSPLMLVLGAVVPALLILMAVWLFLRRRRAAGDGEVGETPRAADASLPAAAAVGAAAVAASADEEEMAIRLDAEEEESLDSLLDMGNVDLAPETLPEEASEDLFVEQVDDFADDGQSLDDLWAEAMGEQEDGEQGAEIEADLDALMAGFDAEEPAKAAKDDEDLDALLAGFDAPEEESISADEPLAEEDELSNAIAAELEAELAETSDTVSDEDLDALLAGFNAPADETADIADADKEDLTDAIAAELESELTVNDDISSDEDLDALLAGFDAPAAGDDIPEAAITSPSDDLDTDLSDAIAAELEGEIATEADTEEDLDALLAGFASEGDAKDLDGREEAADEVLAPQDNLSLADDAFANVLETEISLAEEGSDEDLSALLADFDKEEEAPLEDITAGLGDELPLSDEDEDLDSLLAGFDKEDENGLEDAALAAAAVATAASVSAAKSESGKASEKGQTDADPVAVSARDSGFFDDLKGKKGAASSNMLEWESVTPADAKTPSLDVSDDELLSAFAAEHDDSDDDAFVLDVDADHSMTVDEALAALDASEKSKRQAKVEMDADLSNFQKENGFIDIDKLLNDADDTEPEPYRELDMDIGEVESLIGDTAMVDVDDEENSVNAKLDLARAYIEIDDKDSAKALLKEVEMDGNERQKQEAADLLQDIG